jgi:hypothetical protein
MNERILCGYFTRVLLTGSRPGCYFTRMEIGSFRCTAFVGTRQIVAGNPREVALSVKAFLDLNPGSSALVFDDATGQVIDLDLRGSADAAESFQAPAGARGPGRPRLGVVAREVTLLPRHWEWLNLQPGGASVALRKLVEEARRANGERDRVRQSQEVTYRFLAAISGNEPGYEEVIRALFALDGSKFKTHMAHWPTDVSSYASTLAAGAFS